MAIAETPVNAGSKVPGGALPERLRLLTDLGLWLAAAGILLVLVVRAAVSIDSSHDAWWYHLPWAARLAGLMPADAFVFDDFLEQRYAGFPVLWEWLQGWAWRLTGRPEAANLLSLASLLVFIGFLRARFRVPPQLALLALVAVPLVQIHATAAQVDLPANLALSAALLLLPGLFAASSSTRRLDLALLALACAVTAHAKLQLIPVVALVFAAGALAAALARRREAKTSRPGAARTAAVMLGFALVSVVVFAVPLKNLAIHGNPFYPIQLKVGPIELPGPQAHYLSHTDRLRLLVQARSPAPPAAPSPDSPPRIAASAERKGPRLSDPMSGIGNPVGWLASVLEIGMEPVLGRGLWNQLSAQDPPLPPRHGGFFGWYVLANLMLFAVLALRRPREHAGMLALLAITSLVAALLPNQHILRYYMFWMLLLVSLNLTLLAPGPAATGKFLADGRRLFGVLGLASFLLVVYATRAEFVQPRFYFAEDLIETRRDPAVLAEVERAAPACLAGERPPRVFLYASLFNPGTEYRLKSGPAAGHHVDEIPDACGEGWTPVIATREDAGLLPARPAAAPPPTH